MLGRALAVVAVLGAALAAPVAQAGSDSAVVNRLVPSGGCAAPPPVEPGRAHVREVTSGGITRTYRVHVPADYSPSRAVPVVLSFHGHTADSARNAALTGFSGAGALAVYPQGSVGTDGETAWQGAPYSADADDVLFTSDLLNQLQRDFCVDHHRVYATGNSNGGGFVGILACRMSERIAAFAPVSGAFYPQGEPCDPGEPAPVLNFHGARDSVVPYGGDPGRQLPPIPDWLAKRAERNGCDGQAEVREKSAGVVVSTWNSCREDLVHYRLDAGAHAWPDTERNAAATDASRVIMDFFDQHPL